MNNFPPLIDMMHQLIAQPSISSTQATFDQSNAGVIELLESWLANAGFVTEIIANKTNPNKLNLLAHSHPLTDTNRTPGLVLTGHTDTVPTDPGLWNSDPFKLIEIDQRLYGLGSSDMKLFFALALEAMREVDLNKLQRPISIIATADEETSMEGARTLAELKPFANARVVIGEPSALQPIYAHKGMMTESIIIHGQSGHSSNPAFGASAIDAAILVLSALSTWRTHWQQQHHDVRFEVANPTLNFGCLHGGDNPNRICGQVEIQYDCRPLPGMDLNEIKHTIHQLARQALADTDCTIEFKSLFEGVAAFELPSHSQFYQQCQAITKTAPRTVAFGTEAPFWAAMDCEAIVLGPGAIAQAHQANEYLATNTIEPMVDLLKQFIQRNCM